MFSSIWWWWAWRAADTKAVVHSVKRLLFDSQPSTSSSLPQHLFLGGFTCSWEEPQRPLSQTYSPGPWLSFFPSPESCFSKRPVNFQRKSERACRGQNLTELFHLYEMAARCESGALRICVCCTRKGKELPQLSPKASRKVNAMRRLWISNAIVLRHSGTRLRFQSWEGMLSYSLNCFVLNLLPTILESKVK